TRPVQPRQNRWHTCSACRGGTGVAESGGSALPGTPDNRVARLLSASGHATRRSPLLPFLRLFVLLEGQPFEHQPLLHPHHHAQEEDVVGSDLILLELGRWLLHQLVYVLDRGGARLDPNHLVIGGHGKILLEISFRRRT